MTIEGILGRKVGMTQVFEPSSKTFDALMRLQLPSGVDIEDQAMTIEAGSKSSAEYESAAREFSDRLVERFPKQVHSVVLYGSVARGTANDDSDIDVLVLRDDGLPGREQMVEISDSIDYNNYETRLIVTGMSATKLQGLWRQRFPIAEAILAEGVALYDDGTFQRIRETPAGSGGRDAE